MGLTAADADAGAELAAVVGASRVVSGDRAAACAVDGRVPRWVVTPGTAEEVAACLAIAAARGLAVAPTGRGTRLHWGNPPRRLDVVLSLRRLDRILAHEPDDLTLSVEAGVTLAAIADHLAPYRQLFPLDPPRAGESTVGGLVATAATGPYRARYGTIRDLLLGVTVARPDGTLAKGGGRVVKNVTGYDMPKLHVGALGTLGIVVSAHLRLHPGPASEATWRFTFPARAAALDAALGIMDAPVVVSRLQLLDRAGTASLGVMLASVPEAVRAQGERVRAICEGSGGTGRPVAESGWWAAVSEMAWPERADRLALRAGVRPADMVKALDAVEAAAGPLDRATGEVVNGVLHVILSAPPPDEGPAVLARIREALAPLDGNAVIEYAPAGLKATVDAWGEAGPAIALMRRVKAEMDPSGVLNPGRYVGGI